MNAVSSSWMISTMVGGSLLGGGGGEFDSAVMRREVDGKMRSASSRILSMHVGMCLFCVGMVVSL